MERREIMIEVIPCPFCGSTSIGTRYGVDSCKWGAAICECGAQGPDVRTEYNESEDAPWREKAIEEWNKRAEKPIVEHVAWVFKHLYNHLQEGGTYRYLIYDRMGFESENYQELLSGMSISNAFCSLKELNEK